MQFQKYIFPLMLNMLFLQLAMAQISSKSDLRRTYEEEKQAMHKLWQERVNAFEKSFGQAEKNSNPLQQQELIKAGDKSMVVSIAADMDSNFIVVDAIAVGKTKSDAIAKVENAVLDNLFEKSREVIRLENRTKWAELREFLAENSTPLVKKLSSAEPGMVQAHFKIQQPLLGPKGLLQFASAGMETAAQKKQHPLNELLLAEQYTGLIIDARKLNARPGLIVYVNHNADVLFGPQVADRTKAVECGLVKWHTNLNDAKSDERAGTNPFIVEPTSLERNRIYYVSDTANSILASDAFQNNILKNCRVIIVK